MSRQGHVDKQVPVCRGGTSVPPNSEKQFHFGTNFTKLTTLPRKHYWFVSRLLDDVTILSLFLFSLPFSLPEFSLIRKSNGMSQ